MTIPLGLSFDDVLLIPQLTPLASRSLADTSAWITPSLKLKIPFLSANMDTVTDSKMAICLGKLGGMGVIHQFQSIDREAAEVKKVKKTLGKLPVAAAVGVNGMADRAAALAAAGVDLMVVDAAHGHSPLVADAVRTIKRLYPKMPVLAGNIATKDGAGYLIASGADAVKVGVGPGSVCTTRLVTGAGVPQFSAILAAKSAIGKKRIGLVADGGIKRPGDVVKALAAGATAVMSGNIFAGTSESPGRGIYRGSSTMAAARSRADRGDRKNVADQWSRVEGVEARVPFKGPLAPIIERFLGGLRSGMSYAGARNLAELQKNARFIRITPAGLHESHPHDVTVSLNA